jgi:hypothetical protein
VEDIVSGTPQKMSASYEVDLDKDISDDGDSIDEYFKSSDEVPRL